MNRGALIEKQSYEIKAISVGFELRDQEVEALVDCFKDTMSIKIHGLPFDGVNYDCVRSDEDSIYGRHVKTGL